MEPEEIRQRSCEYITALFHDEREELEDLTESKETLEILEREVRCAMKDMKKVKAAGKNGVLRLRCCELLETWQ